MPSGNRPKPLGDVLESVINELGIRPKIDEARVIETWASLAGPQINGVTSSVWMKGRRLFVKVRSAPWRQELHMRRGEWRRKLNEELGEELVEEIVFR